MIFASIIVSAHSTRETVQQCTRYYPFAVPRIFSPGSSGLKLTIPKKNLPLFCVYFVNVLCLEWTCLIEQWMCNNMMCSCIFFKFSMFYKNAIQYTEAIRLYKTINAFLYPGKDLTARTSVFYSTDLPESVLTYMRKVS